LDAKDPSSMSVADKADKQPKRSGVRLLLLVVVIAVVTSVATVWVYSYLFPRAIEPTRLSQQEQTVLDAKLKRLDTELEAKPADAQEGNGVLQPQRYSEEGASREVSFTQRELNALIATNTDLADKVAINLSRDLVSARLVIPMDPDMPILGGKTLRVSAGLELGYNAGRPIVVLKGVSLWGVPIPNAWLGNLKNVDLIQAYGDESFWHAFASGVDRISVGDGNVTIKLKE
jgi:hypothetical protein